MQPEITVELQDIVGRNGDLTAQRRVIRVGIGRRNGKPIHRAPADDDDQLALSFRHGGQGIIQIIGRANGAQSFGSQKRAETERIKVPLKRNG